MQIESFTTKSGEIVILSEITVFVGPNNSGKSQTLRDIKDRMEIGASSKSVIINEFNFNIPDSTEQLLKGLDIKDDLHPAFPNYITSNH